MYENIAYGEVPHCTTNTSRNDLGGFGMEENVAYGQVPCKSTNMSMNEAYAAFFFELETMKMSKLMSKH